MQTTNTTPAQAVETYLAAYNGHLSGQFTITDESMAAIKALAGATDFVPSSKKGRFITVQVEFKDGEKGSLKIGDTHAAWENHQLASGKVTWKRIHAACKEDQVEVKVLSAKTSGSQGQGSNAVRI